jgi:hypothetical protein
MKYLVSEVENWGREIDALPAPDPGRRKVGKKAAVFLLAKKLQAAARRGFSTAELLEVLASKGLTVHVDTVRAALNVGRRRAVTSPVRNRESIGTLRRLPDGNGTEAEPTTGRWNAGGSGSDSLEHRAEVGPELPLPYSRDAGGESAETEAEKKTAIGRLSAGESDSERAEERADVAQELGLALDRGESGVVAGPDAEARKPAGGPDADGPEGDAPESGAEAGPDTGPAKDRDLVGEVAAGRAGRGRREDGSGRGVTAAAAGGELPAPKPHEVGADTDERPSSADGPGRQVEGGGRAGARPVGVARAGRDALGGRGAEGRPAALAPVRGSFTPREDSDEI